MLRSFGYVEVILSPSGTVRRSVGTSVAQTIHERREQFHTLRLGDTVQRVTLLDGVRRPCG